MMNRLTRAATVVALLASAACGRSDANQAALQSDPALQRDLTSAAQATPPMVMDSVSPLERTGASAASAPQRTATAAAPRRTTSTRHRSSSRTSSSSAGEVSRGDVSASAPAPQEQRTVTVKHGQRDAAIGAAAGAIIGATTTKDRVKGGIIGAAAGGILGGVIGNNVDKQRKRVP